jgi:hypothetical protein
VWARAELQSLWMQIYTSNEKARCWVVNGNTVLLNPVHVLELLAKESE